MPFSEAARAIEKPLDAYISAKQTLSRIVSFIVGAVLLLIGLLIMIFGPLTMGLIVAVFGAVFILFGKFGKGRRSKELVKWKGRGGGTWSIRKRT